MKMDKESLEYIREFVTTAQEDGPVVDIDYVAGEIYGDEINFNNADPTSGQRCWELHEIEDGIKRIIEGE